MSRKKSDENSQKNERVKVGSLQNSGHRGRFEVFLLEFASHRVLVTEDEVDLHERNR